MVSQQVAPRVAPGRISKGGGMTRPEHLEWCKKRALEYVNARDCKNAIGSMLSDLGKHEETAKHAGIQLGMMLMMAGHLSTLDKVKKFIKGFN